MLKPDQIWSIDALDGEWASIEVGDGQIVRMPRWVLPQEAREGDVYRVRQEVGVGRSVVTIVVDVEEAARRLARSKGQVGRKSGNDRGGDVVL